MDAHVGAGRKVGLELIPQLGRLIGHGPVAVTSRGEKYRSLERLPSSSARAPTITPVNASPPTSS